MTHCGVILGTAANPYGGGLFIVTTRPRTKKSHFGGGQIVITTYGMPEEAFADMRRKWTDRWELTYEVIDIHKRKAGMLRFVRFAYQGWQPELVRRRITVDDTR